MSSQETNKALVRRFYAEMDAGNLEAMDELVAEDYLDHNPPPFPGLDSGRAGLKQAFQIFWDATPGHHEIEDQIAEGDRVVTRLTAHGRHEGELPGPIPPSGKEIHMPAVAIHRIADGRLAEHWSGTDELGLLVQLGVVSLPQPPG
jgi:predicted ester cyclase